MKDLFANNSVKLRSLLSVAALFLSGAAATFAYNLYNDASIAYDKAFETISIIQILLILFIGLNLYKLMKEDEFSGGLLSMIREDYCEGDIIFNTISDGIAMVDMKGKIKMANAGFCSILNVQKPDIINKNIYDLYAGMDSEYDGRALALLVIETLESKREHRHKEKVYIKNNESRYLSISTYIMKSQRKKNMGVLCVAHDFTEKKKIEQQMTQVEKLALAGQLAAELAHEIKNPICSIKGLVQIMGKKHGMENGYHYTVVMSEIDRISALLKDFLSLTHARSFYEEISIAEVFSDIMPVLERQAESKSIDIRMEVDDDLPFVLADREHLKQVIINIVHNAIDAVKKDGKIDIYIQKHRDQDKIRLEFKDNGPGIKEEHLHRIFDPFFTTKQDGSGLGLVISKRIVEKHGGKLLAYNNPEGGASFVVELPDSGRLERENRDFMVS